MRGLTERALLVVLVAAGCGDNSLVTGGNDAAQPDMAAAPADLASAPDLATPPDLVMGIGIGMACPTGNECAMGQLCLGPGLNKGLPPAGYCTKSCVNDGDCGAGAFCGPVIPGAGKLCWVECGANKTCAGPGRVCGRYLLGGIDLVKGACLPGNASAKDGGPCKTFGDCNRNSVCVANPYETPGGYCTTFGCTPGDDTTCSPAPGNPGTCLPIGNNVTLCAAGCTVAGDCRMAEGYSCNKVNPMGMGPSACTSPHAAPGAACAKDGDCAVANPQWKCLTGPTFPMGYCSGAKGLCDPKDDNTCPNNSHCYDPTPNKPMSGDEYCTRTCMGNGDCRMAEGYTCITVDANGAIKGCVHP